MPFTVDDRPPIPLGRLGAVGFLSAGECVPKRVLRSPAGRLGMAMCFVFFPAGEWNASFVSDGDVMFAASQPKAGNYARKSFRWKIRQKADGFLFGDGSSPPPKIRDLHQL